MEREQVKALLREKGLKVTKQRMLVLEIMAEHPGEHLTTEEIYHLARKQHPEIGLATIYRAVQVLVDLQLLDKVNFDDGFARYELEEMETNSGHHHHHAICSKCGKVYSFEDDLLENLEQALWESVGFTVTDHEVKLYGYCKDCKRKLEVSD
ncbi:MAG: Fur family transcriptional regulator [Lachnospiraceae bacterium]